LREKSSGLTNTNIAAGAFINPYLALRDYNEVFLWFERAYAEQSGILQFLKVHLLWSRALATCVLRTSSAALGLN
jgi:hypothetical protein